MNICEKIRQAIAASIDEIGYAIEEDIRRQLGINLSEWQKHIKDICLNNHWEVLWIKETGKSYIGIAL